MDTKRFPSVLGWKPDVYFLSSDDDTRDPSARIQRAWISSCAVRQHGQRGLQEVEVVVEPSRRTQYETRYITGLDKAGPNIDTPLASRKGSRT